MKGYQSIITNPLTEKKRRPSSGRRGVGRPHVTRRQQACLTVPRPLLSPLFSYADYSFFSFLFEGISVVNVKSLQNSSSKPREPNKHTTQQNSESEGTKNWWHWRKESTPANQNKANPFLYVFDTHRHNPLLWFYKSLLFLVLLPVLVLVVIENMDCWSPLTMDDEFEKLVIRMNPPRWIYFCLLLISFNVRVFVWIEKGGCVFLKFSFLELKVQIFLRIWQYACVILFLVCV